MNIINKTMKALIFGAKGSIGNYILNEFLKEKIVTVGTTSDKNNLAENIIFVNKDDLLSLNNIEPVDIVIWANGDNCNDNINTYNNDTFKRIIDANVIFILNTMHYLLENNKIKNNAKMLIISSIWEELTRENKLSYSISKAALSGLVKNVAYDLSSQNILINNVLPGVIDNEMSRKTLNKEQIDYIKNYMNFGRLITLSDVYKTVKFLVVENTGITGQSIKVDLGFTSIKKYS